jgi:LCP family protein required for cell wall assembly
MRDDTVGGNGYGTASAHVPDPDPYSDLDPDSQSGPHSDPNPGSYPDGGTPSPEIPSPRRGRKLPKTRRSRILKWVSIGTAVAVLGTAGAAYGYYEYLASKIRKGERSSGTTNVAKTKANSAGLTAMNILILGSDTRNSAEDVALGGAGDSSGARADVIMIAHLSADRSNMSVVSIPRDTRVDIPDCEDPDTKKTYPATNDIINASLGRGGPGCTLATVQNLTGVYIDHWLMIDFAGVVKMADVVGGVDVCVKENVWDRSTAYVHGGSGLKLTAGTHTIEGDQALQWLRTRDSFGSDAGRSKAQHMYMSSLIRKLKGQSIFTNPSKLNSIATAAMSAFKVSEELGSPKSLYDLGMELKTIPSNRITMLTMPHIADPEDPNAHYLPAPDATTIWSLLRSDVAMDSNGKAVSTASPTPTTAATTAGPAAESPSAIPVDVVNGTAGTAAGTPTSGRAGDLATALNTAGYTQAAASQEPKPSPGTTLTYPTSGGAQGKANATAVAKVFKIPASNVKASATVSTITLTIGADWTTGTDFTTTLPAAGSVPDTADATNGADTTGCMDIQPIYQW